MRFVAILLVLVSAVAAKACSNQSPSTFLWSIRRPHANERHFLFGTIHVPYTEVWSHASPQVSEALQASDNVLLEVQLDEDAIRRLIRCKRLPKRQTALSYLPSDIYQRVNDYVISWRHRLFQQVNDGYISEDRVNDVYDNVIGDWKRLRPEWLLFALNQLAENVTNASNSPMLDIFLAEKAISSKKKVESIESIDEQCRPVTSLALSDLVFAIDMAVKRLSSGIATPKASLEKLIHAYRCGELNEELLNFESNSEKNTRLKEIDKLLKKDIIERRNVIMASRLDRILSSRSSENFFIAIGTGHLVGDDSVQKLLQRKGYLVEAVGRGEEISPPRRMKDIRFQALWKKEETIEVSIEVFTSTANHALRLISFIVFLFTF